MRETVVGHDAEIGESDYSSVDLTVNYSTNASHKFYPTAMPGLTQIHVRRQWHGISVFLSNTDIYLNSKTALTFPCAINQEMD